MKRTMPDLLDELEYYCCDPVTGYYRCPGAKSKWIAGNEAKTKVEVQLAIAAMKIELNRNRLLPLLNYDQYKLTR